MEIISFTIPNQYHDLPDEDAFSYLVSNNNIRGIVVDGVTRDPPGVLYLPSHNSPEFSKFVQNYPRPSPAKIISDIFCKKFIETDKEIMDSLKKANEKIKEWNKKNGFGKNFLDEDLACCCGVGFLLKEKELHYVYNADCGLAVFDKEGKRTFITEDLMSVADANRKKEGIDVKEWNNPSERSEFRKNYRNKVAIGERGETLSYGVFSGEDVAFEGELIKDGKIILKDGDFLLAFSDGARDFILDEKKCGEKLIEGLEPFKKYLEKGEYTRKERTVIAVRIN